MTDTVQSPAEPTPAETEPAQTSLSLGTAAARNLATTTKTTPQMQGISTRWLLRVLPWVQVSGAVYRVNRRTSYAIGDGRLTFTTTGADVQVIPMELRELPVLRDFDDEATLNAMADRLVQREYDAGDVIVEFGNAADQVVLIAHGKVNQLGVGEYGDQTILRVLADGQYFGEQVLTDPNSIWDSTMKAVTHCTVLTLPRQAFDELIDASEALREHVERIAQQAEPRQNRHGEAEIELSSGHAGEPDLPGTFVDYEAKPREYELSLAQTVLHVHTRVADLYNQPMDQTEQQLRLTIEALRERQEHELVNNRQFGMLHNADLKQRFSTRNGPPAPDDMDELLSRRRKTRYFLAHPRTIAAFGRECTRQGIYPDNLDVEGHHVMSWRGVPILPCDKIPVTNTNTSSILAMRVGESDEGVIGLHQIGLPDEYEPGLSVRFMGINDKAVISYLVSTYYSAAVLVPDALGVLEHVEVGR